MPLYMDRHDVPGLTAMDVAEGHKQDLKIQHKYGCRAITYWYDEKRGTAFCLIEAPTKSAVEKMHDEAHGLIPRKIIEVDSTLVETFLGRITDPRDSEKGNTTDLLLIREPAFRVIMVIQLLDAPILRARYGKQPLELFTKNIQTSLTKYHGLPVHQTVDTFMASFSVATNAVHCAIEIKKQFKRYSDSASRFNMRISMGLHAGEPVTGDNDFFGDAIQFAKRMCFIGNGDRILVSSIVRDEYRKSEVNPSNRRDLVLMLTHAEEHFVNQLMDFTEQVWNQESVTVNRFCIRMGMSKAQLYRKITALTGYSLNKFINEFRMRKALEMLEKHQGNISEIAFETGFSNPSYFSKCFQKRFGIPPSDFVNLIA